MPLCVCSLMLLVRLLYADTLYEGVEDVSPPLFIGESGIKRHVKG